MVSWGTSNADVRYDAQGHGATFSAYTSSGPGAGAAVKPSELKTLGQVKDDNLGMQDKPDFFTSQATIAFIKNETFAYAACPTDGCNKKVIEVGDAWRCEKCDQNYPAPVYR
jgi:replication factor A1